MRHLLPLLLALGCSGAPFAAGTEPSLLGEGAAGAGGADDSAGGDAPNVVAGRSVGGTDAGGSNSPVAGSGLGGGGNVGTGGGSAAGGSGGAAGAGGNSTADNRCEPPANGPGSICGGACAFTFETAPAGYGHPSAESICGCAPHVVDDEKKRIDVRGNPDACTPSNPFDATVRSSYELKGAGCMRVTAPWDGWMVRAFASGDTNGKKLGTCALVAGPARVEVFGEGDAWVKVEAVECDFGSAPRSCE